MKELNKTWKYIKTTNSKIRYYKTLSKMSLDRNINRKKPVLLYNESTKNGLEKRGDAKKQSGCLELIWKFWSGRCLACVYVLTYLCKQHPMPDWPYNGDWRAISERPSLFVALLARHFRSAFRSLRVNAPLTILLMQLCGTNPLWICQQKLGNTW